MTVVYIDRVLALNGAVDYLLFLATATLSGTPLHRLRFAVCAVMGAIYAALVFPLPALGHPLWRIVVGIALAQCAFWQDVRPWRMTALFWLLSGGLGGFLLALGLLTGSPTAIIRQVYTANISWPILLGAAAGFYCLLYLVFRQGARHGGSELMDIEVVIKGQHCRVRALRDNGNTLRNPMDGQPVLVAEAAALRALWPQSAAEILCHPAPPEEKMAMLYQARISIPFMLLPFRAVGTEGGLLLACRSDHIRIGRRCIPHVLVALTDTQVGAGGYQALWGGGEKGAKYDTVATICTVDPASDQAG